MGLTPCHWPTSPLKVRLNISPPQKPSLEHPGSPFSKSTWIATCFYGVLSTLGSSISALPWRLCPFQQCSWYLSTLISASPAARTRSPCLSADFISLSSFVYKYLTSLHRESSLPVYFSVNKSISHRPKLARKKTMFVLYTCRIFLSLFPKQCGVTAIHSAFKLT